ncbi:hypothetical protein GmHk_12G035037 [Glycine max]|nr:hypothetical protein GmHk_12G035037 [Glycine max]
MPQNFTNFLTMGAKYLEVVKRGSYPNNGWSLDKIRTKKKDEDKGNVIKGPMRLRKEEGLQMVVREGEQSTKTRTKEKKPNLS